MAELFEKFEVNRDPRWQVLTKLVVASLAVHFGLLWAVIYVPALRDTVNIAALIASTKFVDKDYQATQIGDDVQIVKLDKFRYPDGYFALEAQIEGQVPGQPAVDPFAARIISQAGSNRNVDPAASPSPSPETSPSPGARRSARAVNTGACRPSRASTPTAPPTSPTRRRRYTHERAEPRGRPAGGR